MSNVVNCTCGEAGCAGNVSLTGNYLLVTNKDNSKSAAIYLDFDAKMALRGKLLASLTPAEWDRFIQQ